MNFLDVINGHASIEEKTNYKSLSFKVLIPQISSKKCIPSEAVAKVIKVALENKLYGNDF